MKAVVTHRAWGVSLLAVMLIALGGVNAPTARADREDDAGTSAGALLRLGMGARSPALGDAGVADGPGVDATHYNPAALAFLRRAQFSASYQQMVLDIGNGELAYVRPGGGTAGWGLALRYLDYGASPRVTVRDLVNNNTVSQTFTGQDVALSVSYGQLITDAWSWGLTLRSFHETIDRFRDSAYMADAGLAWRPTGWPVRFGLTAQNLGTSLTLHREDAALPALGRLGMAADLFGDLLTISADAEKARGEGVTAQVGVEVHASKNFDVRAGYDGRVEADHGFTFGLAARVLDLEWDYAFVPFGELGDNHRVSLRMSFGPERY